MRYHLAFKNFRQPVLDVTQEFFDSGPWQGTPDEIFMKFNEWVKGAAGAYGVEPPNLVCATEEAFLSAAEDGWVPMDHDILVTKLSVLTVFWRFRHYLHQQGVRIYTPDCESDARGWACSLFYRFRPGLFRKAVRSDMVRFPISKEDLLTSETLDHIRQLRLEGRLADADALLMGEEPVTLTETERLAFDALSETVAGNSGESGEDG